MAFAPPANPLILSRGGDGLIRCAWVRAAGGASQSTRALRRQSGRRTSVEALHGTLETELDFGLVARLLLVGTPHAAAAARRQIDHQVVHVAVIFVGEGGALVAPRQSARRQSG